MTDSNVLVAIEDVEYSVTEKPDKASALVLSERAKVLQNLELSRIISNLERTNDLLHVAACGVSGSKDTTLSGKVSNLQYGLLTACSEASLAMVDFKQSSESVLNSLQGGFRYLYHDPPREDRALKMLKRCADQAEKMAKTADKLSSSFKALADDAQETLTKTYDTRELEHQAQLDAEERHRQLDALNEEQQSLRDSLKTQVAEMQQLVDEAREAQAKAEDRAFGLAITSAICSALSSGVQAFAAYKTAPLTAGTNIAQSVFGDNGTKDGGTTKPSAKAATKPDVKVETDAEDADDAKVEDFEMKSDDGASDEKSKDAATASGEGSDNAAAAAAAAAAGTQAAADSTKDMAGSYNDIAESHAKEKKEYLDKLYQLKESERTALASIAKFAKQMENADVDASSAEAAVNSLQQAVAALKQIVTVLETAKLFWTYVGNHCRQLISKNLEEDIEMIAEDSPEERLVEYNGEEFKKQLVTLAAGWYALQLIAEEYQDGVNVAREEVKKTINLAPTIEEARKQAPELGRKLSLSIEADLAVIAATATEVDSERSVPKAPE